MAGRFHQVDGLSGAVHRVTISPSPLLAATRYGRLRRARHYCFDALPFMAHPRSLPGLQQILDDLKPDLVLTYLPHLAHLALVIPAEIPVVGVLEEGWERALPHSTGDLGALSRRLVLTTERRRVHRLYRRISRRCIGIVVISDDERDQFSSLMAPSKLAVFPHGVDCDYFSPASNNNESDRATVGVIADFAQPRNVRGLEHIVATLKLENDPSVREWNWLLVGRGSPEMLERLDQTEDLRSIGTFVATGRVEDVRPYYRRSSAVLVPDLEGTGVKTTVLQGWAMAKPVVATQAATRGLPITPGTDILVGTSSHELIRHVRDLLADPARRVALGAAGRATVIADRDLRRIAATFATYCSDLLAGDVTRRARDEASAPSARGAIGDDVGPG